MAKYVAGRILSGIPVLIAISLIAFVLVHLSGDPVRMMLPIYATPEDEAAMRAKLGLDRPVHVQYGSYMLQLLRDDLGESVKFNIPVSRLMSEKLPQSLYLVSSGLGLACFVGVPLGVLAATRAYRLTDNVIVVGAMMLISIPSFWLALMLMMVLAEWLRLLPPEGSGSIRHLIMPAIAVGTNTMGVLIRLLRANIRGILKQDYVRTARAKGLAERIVLFKHVLKNGLIPAVTFIGLRFGHLLGASIIIESIFGWPGFGWLIMQGVYARDLPVVRAGLLTMGVVFVGINILVDLIYCYLDPRIRYS